jgi:hypothetical protein
MAMNSTIFTNMVDNRMDIVAFQGKTIQIPLIIYEDDDVTIQDVTGYTAQMIIKEMYSDASAFAEFNAGNSRVTIGSTNGLITLTMSHTDSAALSAPFQGVYEIEITDNNGNRANIYGDFTLKAEAG